MARSEPLYGQHAVRPGSVEGCDPRDQAPEAGQGDPQPDRGSIRPPRAGGGDPTGRGSSRQDLLGGVHGRSIGCRRRPSGSPGRPLDGGRPVAAVQLPRRRGLATAVCPASPEGDDQDARRVSEDGEEQENGLGLTAVAMNSCLHRCAFGLERVRMISGTHGPKEIVFYPVGSRLPLLHD